MCNTLHHGRLAALTASDGLGELENTHDGLKTSFQHAWEPYKIDHISLFLEIPVIGVVTILTIMFLFHILGSTCILKLTNNKKTTPELMLEGFHTLIASPLHIDWEMFYRMSDGKQSIKHYWRRLIRKDNISS